MKKERNKIFRNLRYLGLVCVSVIGLMCIVATGGGDDEDGASVDTSLPLGLSAANAPGVSGLVFDTAEGGFAAASIGSNAFISASSPDAGGFELNFLRFIGDVLDQILAMEPQQWQSLGGVRAIPIPPSPVDCSPGAILLNVVTDNPPAGELTTGDFIILTHNGCSQQGLVLDGDVTVGILSVVGDPPGDGTGVTFRLNFNGLTATDGGSVVQVLGTLDVTVSFLAGGTVIADLTTELGFGAGSSFLDFSEGGEFSRLTVFTISFQEDAVGNFTLFAQGTLESSYIGGTVTFQTTAPLTGTDFDTNDPSGGELVITGAGNAKVRLRVINITNVELDVDLDGDGTYDITIPTTWAALDAAVDAL